jgi:hypothetical protein
MSYVVHVRDRYDVYIGRGPCPKTSKLSEWGNPFSHLAQSAARYRADSRADAIARYRAWLLAQPALVARAQRELRGKVLGCWCAPDACHGDVLAEIANAQVTP